MYGLWVFVFIVFYFNKTYKLLKMKNFEILVNLGATEARDSKLEILLLLDFLRLPV